MSELVAYLTVLIAAAIPWLEVLLVVPAGIIAGLPPVPTVVVAAIGNTATLVPLVLAGDRLRDWWRERRGSVAPVDRDAGDEPPGRSGRARRLFDRFGLPGLAALGPLLTGIHVAAVVALAAGADRRAILVWLTAGVAVWSGLAAIATVIGLEALVDPDALPDLGLS
ncbi:MAG: small multi-drug export protein [Nitriliruptor sp.]|uniref:small multi-drug export protein n=1 Tax=Nitriliruptor sp. TaxID=2448056 RepID=UPI00349FE47F